MTFTFTFTIKQTIYYMYWQYFTGIFLISMDQNMLKNVQSHAKFPCKQVNFDKVLFHKYSLMPVGRLSHLTCHPDLFTETVVSHS